MAWSQGLGERVRKRLVAKVYLDGVLEYITRRFNIPRDKVSIAFEPTIAGVVRPDLVVMYNGMWFIVEFKTWPNIVYDIEQVLKFKRVIDEYVKPQHAIPILAYVYIAPPQNIAAIAKGAKPLVVLHLIHGTYRVLYESL